MISIKILHISVPEFHSPVPKHVDIWYLLELYVLCGLYFIVFHWVHLLVDILNVRICTVWEKQNCLGMLEAPAEHNNKTEAVVKLMVLKRQLYRLQYNCIVTVVHYAVQFPLHFRLFFNVYTFRHTRNTATETVIYLLKDMWHNILSYG